MRLRARLLDQLPGCPLPVGGVYQVVAGHCQVGPASGKSGWVELLHDGGRCRVPYAAVELVGGSA